MQCEYIWSVHSKIRLSWSRDSFTHVKKNHQLSTATSGMFTCTVTWVPPPGPLLQQLACTTKEFLHQLSEKFTGPHRPHSPMLQGIGIMETENIAVLARPARSPDTSPTEHVCDALEPHDMFQSLPCPAASRSPRGPTEWTEILIFPCLFKHKAAQLTVAFYCADIIKQSSLCHHSEWGLALCKSPFNTFKTFSSSVIIIRTSESTMFSISNLFCACCLSMTLCWPHWNLDSYQPCRLI